jgi:ribose 5-phosphate isomerase B
VYRNDIKNVWTARELSIKTEKQIMKIAIACDHAGFTLKDQVIKIVKENNHIPIDFGTNGTKRVDYPDYAKKAAKAVSSKKADRAIIICGSGVGACITANKFKGVRAGICHDTYSASQGVEHDDMNVLCLGARIVGKSLADKIVEAFLSAKFSNEKRHQKRLDKIKLIEKENMK